MDRYAVKGFKKLSGLCRTKIRLAEEAGTVNTRPSPLPLPRLYSGVELKTVEECRKYAEELRNSTDFDDSLSVAYATLELCDIIEGVKYDFEPPEYMPLTDEVPSGKPATILLMADAAERPEDSTPVFIGRNPPEGVRQYSNLFNKKVDQKCVSLTGHSKNKVMHGNISGDSTPVFIGRNPPEGVRHYSRVVSGVAPLLHHLYSSEYHSDGKMLKNVEVLHGSRTLLGDAVYHALSVLTQ